MFLSYIMIWIKSLNSAMIIIIAGHAFEIK